MAGDNRAFSAWSTPARPRQRSFDWLDALFKFDIPCGGINIPVSRFRLEPYFN